MCEPVSENTHTFLNCAPVSSFFVQCLTLAGKNPGSVTATTPYLGVCTIYQKEEVMRPTPATSATSDQITVEEIKTLTGPLAP